MEGQRVDLGGVELSVLTAGPPAGHPLLLVHGFGAAKEDFAEHIDPLGELGWRAVVPDLRGHGSSSKPDDPGAYSLERFAADLLLLADRLGWDHFTLLGHSMGGMVAQLVALAAPDRLDALVLMDTSHGALAEDVAPELIALGKQVISEGGMQAYVEVSKTIDGPLDTDAYLRLLERRPELADYGDRKALAVAPAMWLGMIDELTSHDAPDRLDALAATIRVPTLVLVGSEDRMFVPHAERLAGAIPGAHLAVIEGGGHSPQFEEPEAWFAALTAFLATVATTLPTASGGVFNA